MPDLSRGPYAALPENHSPARETIQRLDLPPDGRAIVLSGEVRGAGRVHYVFHADNYDRLLVSIRTDSRNCAFNLYPPDQDDACYDGWADGPDWGDTLHWSGDHRIEVYMGHKAARDEGSRFTLTIQRFED